MKLLPYLFYKSYHNMHIVCDSSQSSTEGLNPISALPVSVGGIGGVGGRGLWGFFVVVSVTTIGSTKPMTSVLIHEVKANNMNNLFIIVW